MVKREYIRDRRNHVAWVCAGNTAAVLYHGQNNREEPCEQSRGNDSFSDVSKADHFEQTIFGNRTLISWKTSSISSLSSMSSFLGRVQ